MKYEARRFRKIEIDTEKGIFLIDGEDIAEDCEWLQITFNGGMVKYEAKMYGVDSISKEAEEREARLAKEFIEKQEALELVFQNALLKAFGVYEKLKDASKEDAPESEVK